MRSPPKDAARRGPGVGVGLVNHRDHITSAAELLAVVVPGGAPHVPDYVALAVLLQYPSWAVAHLRRLHPADFTCPLHQIIARCAISDIRNYGRADLSTIRRFLVESDDFQPQLVGIELRTLRRVADLIVRQELVRWAVDQMVADRQHQKNRGAP